MAICAIELGGRSRSEQSIIAYPKSHNKEAVMTLGRNRRCSSDNMLEQHSMEPVFI